MTGSLHCSMFSNEFLVKIRLDVLVTVKNILRESKKTTSAISKSLTHQRMKPTFLFIGENFALAYSDSYTRPSYRPRAEFSMLSENSKASIYTWKARTEKKRVKTRKKLLKALDIYLTRGTTSRRTTFSNSMTASFTLRF
jgi:hypothetical protein